MKIKPVLCLILFIFSGCIQKSEYDKILVENEQLKSENAELHNVLDHYIFLSKRLVNTTWQDKKNEYWANIRFGENSFSLKFWNGDIISGDYLIDGDTVIIKYIDFNVSIQEKGSLIGDSLSIHNREFFRIK